ncbi:hypothetical protein DENSPDRAFT_516178 [Dentipellis sp. KUC8613]|nr:hypothetical protein DENSPDRAFT_516178 [Dentipellis sp. KUC8613]
MCIQTYEIFFALGGSPSCTCHAGAGGYCGTQGFANGNSVEQATRQAKKQQDSFLSIFAYFRERLAVHRATRASCWVTYTAPLHSRRPQRPSKSHHSHPVASLFLSTASLRTLTVQFTDIDHQHRYPAAIAKARRMGRRDDGMGSKCDRLSARYNT